MKTTSKKTRKMKKQVSVIFMVTGLLFATCLIIANIVVQKIIVLGGIFSTAGLLIFPISYIVNDIIAEVWGYKKARMIIWYGFLMNLLAVLVFQLSIEIRPAEAFTHQDAYAQILGSTPRLALASFVAFLLGSFVNAMVMSKMKIIQKGRNFSIRAVVSTLFGEGMDSIVFFTVAFVGTIPFRVIVGMMITQTLMKTGYEILVLPLTNRLVKWVKKQEQENVFDQGISYNPFKIGDI